MSKEQDFTDDFDMVSEPQFKSKGKFRLSDVRISVCSVCGKRFGEVKKCYNVKCTNPPQKTES